MDIQVGQYKNTGYVFNSNTRTITVFGFPYLFDQSVIKLVANQTGLNNSNIGYVIGAPTLWNATITGSTPTTTLTAGAPSAGGNVNIGTHNYVVTYIYNTGDETLASIPSNTITATGTNRAVALTNIPTGNTKVVSRNIYRSGTGTTGNFLLLTTITGNTQTTYTDITLDASLTTAAPLISNIYDIKYFNTLPLLNSNDKIFIRAEIPDETIDFNLNANKVINQAPEWSHFIDQNEPINYLNQASGTTRDVLYTAGYTTWFAGLVATAGASSSMIITFQIPLLSSCIDTDDVNWKDITLDLTGQSSIVVNTSGSISLYWIWNQFPVERFMVKISYGGASVNTATFSYRLSN